jgi:hypothetical protein
VRERVERQVVGGADVLHADGGRRPDRLLGHVGVDVGDRAPDPQGERGGGARERRLARVEPAEEHDGMRVTRSSVDELLVLVHGRSSSCFWQLPWQFTGGPAASRGCARLVR